MLQTQTNESQFLTIGEASSLLKVKVSTLYAWVYQRKIPFRKHGSRVVFERGELFFWSEKRKVPVHLAPAWESDEPCDKEVEGSLKTRRNDETP